MDFFFLSLLFSLFIQCYSSCLNHGEVLELTRPGTSFQVKICINGNIVKKEFPNESTGCLHIPHSLMKTLSLWQNLGDEECIAEDGKARKQGFGVLLGELRSDYAEPIPILFEFCGNATLDPCCQNVHSINGPFSCLVFTTDMYTTFLAFRKHVLLSTGSYEYFATASYDTRMNNLGYSLVNVGYSLLPSYGKRTSMTQFLPLTLEWLWSNPWHFISFSINFFFSTSVEL